MFDSIKQRFVDDQTQKNTTQQQAGASEAQPDTQPERNTVNRGFSEVDRRMALTKDAVSGDDVDFELLATIAEEADIHTPSGVKNDIGTPSRVGKMIVDVLEGTPTEDREDTARRLAMLRGELDEGAPSYLFSTGEKGMWKQCKNVKISTLEWVLNV